MAVLTFLTTFFNKNRYSVIVTVLAIIFAFVNLIQFNQNAITKKKLAVAEHNLQAANDTLRVTIDKAGKEETNKLAFLMDEISDLKKMNVDLYNEVKNIKGKVSTVIQGDVTVVEKPVPFVVKAELADSTVRADFAFDTTYSPGNFRKIAGYTKYNLKNGESSGVKTTDEIGIKFTTGIKNLDKGKPEIFLKSDYPGFSVTALEGAVIDPNLFKKPRQKKLSVGLHVGYSPLYYNLDTKKTGFANQLTAGVGLNYKIF
jgi:hypothetical protein